MIARAEWTGDRGTFDRMDRNNDGVVTWSEYSNVPGENSAAAHFDELDRNNDGVISRIEWRGESTQFGTADRNNDNVVTPRRSTPRCPAGPPAPATPKPTACFRTLDRNSNGTLERGRVARREVGLPHRRPQP